MKKFLVIFAFFAMSLQNCDFIEQWIRWNYGGYGYNVPIGNQSWNWFNQGWNNNITIDIRSQYFNGVLSIPLPQGINPQYYGYSFNGNQCYLNFYDQYRNQICGTSYYWRNNNPNNFYFGNYYY